MKISTTLAAAAITAMTAIAPAMAAPIADGTVSTSDLFNPTINLTSSPNTYSVSVGSTVNTNGTGGFAGIAGRTGTENGTLQFSSTPGTTINQTASNFFVFNDAARTYSFSVSSVRTENYSTSAASNAIALYLLGNTTATGFDATPTSLTLNFNSTGGSAYSAYTDPRHPAVRWDSGARAGIARPSRHGPARSRHGQPSPSRLSSATLDMNWAAPRGAAQFMSDLFWSLMPLAA